MGEKDRGLGPEHGGRRGRGAQTGRQASVARGMRLCDPGAKAEKTAQNGQNALEAFVLFRLFSAVSASSYYVLM